MIDIVQNRKKDWHQSWLESGEHEAILSELDSLVDSTLQRASKLDDNAQESAMGLWAQT